MRSLSILALIFISGCAAPVAAPNTVSGRPEVKIAAPLAAVRAEALRYMTGSRWRLERDGQSQLVFRKPSDNAAVAILMTCRVCAPPDVELSMTLIELPEGVQIVADTAWITSQRSPVEKRIEIPGTAKATQDTQFDLDRIRENVTQDLVKARATQPGRVPKAFR